MGRKDDIKLRIFKEFNVLIPELASPLGFNANCCVEVVEDRKDQNNDNINSWPVIAVDQFTSQPEYWAQVRNIVRDKISAYYLVFPEAEFPDLSLKNLDVKSIMSERVKKINDAMREYLDKNIFKEYKNSYVYVERKMLDGSVRTGIIGIVDLEQYDYKIDVKAAIRATEKTVTERIPPRKAIRENAPLELTHVLMLCDDIENKLIAPFEHDKSGLIKLYDIDLMLDGGNISGWLVTGVEAEKFNKRLDDYVNKKNELASPLGEVVGDRKGREAKPLIFAVGDGNHSLATAKECYEELKRKNPDLDLSNHPARYAMVELENIHDTAQKFEPVHRILKNVDVNNLLGDIKKICVDLVSPLPPLIGEVVEDRKGCGDVSVADREGDENSWPVKWVSGNKTGTLYINKNLGILVTEILQNYLDEYMINNRDKNIEIDFIHEDAALTALAESSNKNIGFLLPPIDKTQFFNWVVVNGILPRKTFSMGHAQEKRYYLEARKIRTEI